MNRLMARGRVADLRRAFLFCPCPPERLVREPADGNGRRGRNRPVRLPGFLITAASGGSARFARQRRFAQIVKKAQAAAFHAESGRCCVFTLAALWCACRRAAER